LKRRSAVAAFGIALVAVTAAGEATAATPIRTSVTILNGNGERFTGKVSSPKKACLRGRRVTLYMKSIGRRSYGYPGYEAVGRTTTRSNGTWEVKRGAEEAFQEGDYRAFVAAKRVNAGDQSLLCASRWGPIRHA
jgi:hypothetical protein